MVLRKLDSWLSDYIRRNNKSGKVSLVVGAAGGTRIPTSLALTVLHNLYHLRSLENSSGGQTISQLVNINMLY